LLRLQGFRGDGARRIRTADLLGAIQGFGRHGPDFQTADLQVKKKRCCTQNRAIFRRICADIHTDMQGFGHESPLVPNPGEVRFESPGTRLRETFARTGIGSAHPSGLLALTRRAVIVPKHRRGPETPLAFWEAPFVNQNSNPLETTAEFRNNTLVPEAKFNWHPKVHAHEDEVLWFFLVRFVDPTADAVDALLKKGLERAGLMHSCTYALYGYWDGLLRVWMTVGAKRKFLRMMKDKPNEFGVADIRDFEVASMYYLWNDRDADLLDDAQGPSLERLNAFQEKVREVRGAVERLSADDRDRLRANHLLIERPTWPSGEIKLYIALDYTSTTTVRDDLEVSLVRQAIDRAGLMESCSLYGGAGFTRYLIRCIATDYAAVLRQTQTFYGELHKLNEQGLPLRPTTFVIIQASEESDNLNVFESLSSPDEVTAQRLALSADGRDSFKGLSDAERARVHDLLVKIDELSLSDPRLTDALLQLLRGSVEDDYTAVIASLWFLIDLEWLFRQYAIRSWARRYGRDDWFGALRSEFGSRLKELPGIDAIISISPAEWNFGQVHRLAVASAEVDAQYGSLVDGQLGSNWQGRFRGLIDLRNLAAHGTIRSLDLNDLTGTWGQKVEELVRSAGTYFLLDKLVNRSEDVNED
jgi:hypothetical protein